MTKNFYQDLIYAKTVNGLQELGDEPEDDGLLMPTPAQPNEPSDN